MTADCGSSHCPVQGGFYDYNPNLGGNVVLLAVSALLATAVFLFGFRNGTPWFSVAMTTGLLLEVLGFVGRVLMHDSQDSQTFFVLSLLGSLLGPIFICGSVIWVQPHILNVYGSRVSPVNPSLAAVAPCCLLVVAGVLQLVGMVLIVYRSTDVGSSAGAQVVAGGVGVQLASLVIFAIFHLWFILSLSSRRERVDLKHAAVFKALRFARFLRALELATLFLIAYTIYRLAEMASGPTSSIFQNEAAFMIINGAFPLLACIILTVFHPGVAFGSAWTSTSTRASFKMRASSRPLQPLPSPLEQTAHHRYDPEIRKQFSPGSAKSHKSSTGHTSTQQRSPGLPQNPRPARHSGSSQMQSAGTHPSPGYDGRFTERPALPVTEADLVDRENLW